MRARAWAVLRSQRPRLSRAYFDAVLAAAYPSVPEPQRWIAFPENPVSDFRAMDALAGCAVVATTDDQRLAAITVLMDAAPSTVLFASTVVWPGATVKAIHDVYDQWANVTSDERRRLIATVEDQISARRAG